MMNMHEELRLSVALEIVPAKGMGALIKCSHSIDKYTRFLLYSYFDREEYFPDHVLNSKQCKKLQIPAISATHIITQVNWGIDSVIVLQLPHNDEIARAIDCVIENICVYLKNDHNTSVIPANEIHQLKQIIHTEVFSNIPSLTRINSIVDFYDEIFRLKRNSSDHCQYNYTLYPIQYFYPQYNEKSTIFIELQPDHMINVERYLLYLSSTFKKLKVEIEHDVPKLGQYLQQVLHETRTQWSKLQEMYTLEIQRIRDLIIEIRNDQIDQSRIDQALSSDTRKKLAVSISDFLDHMNGLKKKELLIGELLREHFEYRNAADYEVEHGNNEQTIERKLLTPNKRERILCSNAILNKKNQSEWHNFFHQLLEERDKNPGLQLIYADFSYCSFELSDTRILPAIELNNNGSISKPMASASLEQSRNDEIINVLLLGESGVGKSTFINSFVNYLTFKTLEQAQSNKPIVLIPVSFLITTGDNFDEHLVKFDKTDNANNEDHDHPGQSVTQHCKSYVFTLNDGNNDRKKLRIIDTPGIGDTRGLAQDDLNMQQILSFINNLSHLDAVCILMRPNVSRLNIYFRSCFTQLFDFLDENARNNIIFCFTNARSTFYAPGNTVPLLKEMLKSLPIKEIPFKKDNTFCFDSESFRYLVAVQNGIEFSNDQKHECEVSWTNSVVQSNRLLEYIRTNIRAYLIKDERKSIKHAQLKISHMARPMLEAMRNILRNFVLWDMESPMESIELCPKTITSPKAICFLCKREPRRFGNIWITADKPHDFQSRCQNCQCPPSKHIPIEYELDYNPSSHPEDNRYNEMTKMLHQLCQTSAQFAHFLMDSLRTSQTDPFLSGLKRMIKEERDICKTNDPSYLNSKLLENLENVKTIYEEVRKTTVANPERNNLSAIYDSIETVSKYPMIESQMAAVKQWQESMMKYYESEVQI